MFGRARDMFHSKAMEDIQRLFSTTTIDSKDLAHISLLDTIRTLFLDGQSAAAQKMRVSSGMDERHFYHMKIDALGLQRDWSGLESFATSKRSPVGYIPFVSVCQQYKAPRSVLVRFIEKIGDAGKRAELLAQASRSP